MASPTTPTAYITCPHCKVRMHTRGHVMFSALTKQLVAACPNPECLFSSNVTIEISKQLQPSLRPNPEITAALTRQGDTR